MVEHIKTDIVTPLWAQPDDVVPHAEQARRLTGFRHGTLEMVDRDCTKVVAWCELWKGQEIYKGFAATWDAFCLDVLGIEPAWVDRLCAGLRVLRAQGQTGAVPAREALTIAERAQALAADDAVTPSMTHTEAGALGGRGQKAHYDITSFSGTGQTSLVKRLKRDAPVIAEALARGEYPSARAAAKAAGIEHDQQRIWLSSNPQKAAQALVQKFDEAYLHALIAMLQEQLHAVVPGA